MAPGPDLGQGALLADERIAGGGRAVGRHVDYLAQIVVELLRHIPGWRLRAVADGDEQIAVVPDGNAAALIRPSLLRQRRPGAEDDGHIVERTGDFIEARACNNDLAVVVTDGFAVGEQDATV